MNTEELIRELPKGILNWYEFKEGAKALFITESRQQEIPFDVLIEELEDAGLIVSCMSALEVLKLEGTIPDKNNFDYILVIGGLEYCTEIERLLTILKGLLTEDGHMLIGADNRLGIRYFCGDRDAFTGRNFDGIENYYSMNEKGDTQMKGRAYAKAELEEFLEKAGLTDRRFYSVFPELAMPQMIFAEDYLPQEELAIRLFPSYRNPDSVFLEEERLYTSLVQNGLFHPMANAYLIECSLDKHFENMKQVTISLNRGKEDAMITIIRRDETVVKKAVYPEGARKLEQLMQNDADLRAHNIPMVESKLVQKGRGTSYEMPYIHGEIAVNYFRRLMKEDKEKFLQELDAFREMILHSSEHVSYEEVKWEQFDPDWERRKVDDPNIDEWKKVAFSEDAKDLGVILRRGYIDLVVLNCFRTEEGFLFFDQEFGIENLPANAIMVRVVEFIYGGSSEFEKLIPISELFDRYGLSKYIALWRKYAFRFLEKLCNDKPLRSFHELHRGNKMTIHSNRQRMNYSAEEYKRVFQDILCDVEGKKLFLFGAGRFTKRFLVQFGTDYTIDGIIDNSPEKWGTQIEGITVSSADILKDMQPDAYKVIICVKNYVPIMLQLKNLGVVNYGIYDWTLEYPRKEIVVAKAASGEKGEDTPPKKYHVGYVAGVFDLFHMGHLNMFKRAKEQCDYLIVGVVNDEAVRKNKKASPYVPFEERIEMVRSCKYVDEAIELPEKYGDTADIYRRYRFDVQFSGSDYANDPDWLAKKVFLQKQGADMVFFPYTQSTSSTKLKSMIEKGLL